MPTTVSAYYPPAHAHIDEILGAPPPRLVRYGSALLLCVILLIIVITGFIGYTDEITLQASLQGPAQTVLPAPADAGNDYCITFAVPKEMAARLTPGQEAVLHLARFPEADFDTLRAVIVSLPYARPGTKELIAEARLTQGFTTTSGKSLQPGTWMSGTVSVITGRKSLLRSLLHF